jgi:hypothetical protein
VLQIYERTVRKDFDPRMRFCLRIFSTKDARSSREGFEEIWEIVDDCGYLASSTHTAPVSLSKCSSKAAG